MTIETLLIANRGEIARRVIRAARAMGLHCAVVYVDADAHSPFVADADVAIRLASSYLDGAAILDAAHRVGADALHPGYGYLSENGEFAEQVEQAGLIWVGPSPEVLRAMGDKLTAKRLAVAAGLAVLPTSDDPRDGDAVGYPLMVKAAAGGGGKGMRVVTAPLALADAVSAAQREAQHAFGDDRVFLERYVASSRHVEIQILGDRHGHLVHLGERECSIQRRHQKLVEESPSPALASEQRAAMATAAVELARSLDYYSAGTVEFLVDEATRDFYFLEVNTRLQVEHPVTEAVTGIDLVREQLRIANGEVLDYQQGDVTFRGHAIEVRLCAEEPSAGFLPATGTLVAFEPAEEPMVRWESGVEQGSVVTVDFDPLLAKIIAHAPTRAQAAAKLALALERLHLGGVATNRDFLAATLRHEGFLRGDTTTDFIERYEPRRTLELDEAELCWTSTAGALWLQGEHRSSAPVWTSVPSGWRNARLPRQQVALRWLGRELRIDYCARRDGQFDVGEGGLARIHHFDARGIDIEVNGRRASVRVTRSGGHLYVQSLRGTASFEIVPRFNAPVLDVHVGGLSAPMPGVILDVRVVVGQRVHAGETLIVMEAMKMEHVISAPSPGVVSELRVSMAQQVESGTVLLTIESDDPPTSDEVA